MALHSIWVHEAMHQCYLDFAQVHWTAEISLSRPFQLALGFTIVSYETHFSTLENLTQAQCNQMHSCQPKILPQT